MDLFKTLGRLSVPGLIWNDLKWLFSRITGKPNSNLYDDIGSEMQNSGLDLNIGAGIGSLFGKYSGANPTGQDIWNQEQNERNMQLQYQYQRDLRSTAMQDTIKDFQAAGVNPAIAYGQGPTSVSSPSGGVPGVSPGNLSDLIALMTLPAQLGLIKAQTKKVEADTENTQADTRIKSITADWMPSLNEADIANLRASVARATSEIGLNQSKASLIDSQSKAQDITNEYLPSKLSVEISQIKENINKMSVEERNIKASAWFTEIQANYAYDNKALMSNNDMVCLATYIGSLFGVSRSDVEGMISRTFDYFKSEDFKLDIKPWRKPSSEEVENWIARHFGSKD